LHWLRAYEGPRGVVYLFAVVAALGPPTVAMFLLEPTLLGRLDWPLVLMLCAASGATCISLCLVGAVIALMPPDEKLNVKSRADALKRALTLAFAISLIVEVGALALATRHGKSFSDYVRWSLQLSVAGAAFVVFAGWLHDRAERQAEARTENNSSGKPG
jgi:hypothetical protein